MAYRLITCIVERGKADGVIDAAVKAGAQAATVFFARGRGVKERLRFLGRFLQSEKEVILIVVKNDFAGVVFDIVVAKAELKVPGRGFAYIQPVEQTAGFLDI